MKSKIDPFHAQIVAQYFKRKEDYINFILIKKDFEYILDRFRINPIPITNDTQKLFQFLDTQQVFRKEDEVILNDIDTLQINYELDYKNYLKMKEEYKQKEIQVKAKKISYGGKSIPEEVSILEKYDSHDTEVVVPSHIKQIKGKFLMYDHKIKTVIIPDSVTQLGWDTFSCCDLETLILSTNLTECPKKMVNICYNFKHIKLPPYLKKLGHGCFLDCRSLKEIVIPSTVESIGGECFRECSSLQSIIFPSSVTKIGKYALRQCSQLKELIVENKNCHIEGTFFFGCDALTKLQLPTINGYCTFIPSYDEKLIMERNGIKSYHFVFDAIERKELKSLEFINDEKLLQYLISCYDYTSLYIPTTVTEIRKYFFWNLKNLKEIILPPHITVFDDEYSTLENKKVNYIKYTDGRTSIENKVFYSDYKILKTHGIHCKNIISCEDILNDFPTDSSITMRYFNDENLLKLKNIPTNVTEIVNFNFLDESITSLSIPSTVKKITNSYFLNNKYFSNLVELKCYKNHVENIHLIDKLRKLTKIEIIDGNLDDVLVRYKYHLIMKEKGILFNNVDYIWKDIKKYGYKIPSIVKSIDNSYKNIYSINELINKKIVIRSLDKNINYFTIPSYQTKLYDNMFCDNVYLSQISIPKGIKEVGINCFKNCHSLFSIEYDNEMNGNSIKNCYYLESIPVIKSLEISNFENYSYLTSIKLSDSIEKIPTSCFNQCLMLKEFNIPSRCTEIDSFAFKLCISLTSIHIPKNVKKMNDGAFYCCYSLEKIVIDNPEIELGYNVFGFCNSIKEIIFNGEKMKNYKYEIKYPQMKQFEKIGIECPNIVIHKSEVYEYGIQIINDSRVKRLHDNCSRKNNKITELIIPSHITKLGMFSFSNCSNLTKLVIPSTIKEIPYCCFEHCSNLHDVIFEDPDHIQLERKCFWQCHSLSEASKKYIPEECINSNEESEESVEESDDMESWLF